MIELVKKTGQGCNLKGPAECKYQHSFLGFHLCGALIGPGGEVSYCPYCSSVEIIIREI